MDLTQLNDYTTRSEAVCRRNDTISPRLYEEYGVKKGLRRLRFWSKKSFPNCKSIST